jgi:hypothetical protein
MKAHLQTWRQRWKRALQNRMTARELEAISPAERMRLADDVCMSGTDLRRFNCTHDGPSKLMPSRLEQLGIDPAYVRLDMVGTYRDLERVCATCRSARRCARDLAKGNSQAGMGSYCLNSATIDALLVDRALPTA